MKRIAMLVGGLVAAHSAFAGIYVETVSHDLKTDTTQLSQKMYVQDGSGRFVDDGGRTTLIKGDTMYIIDDSDQSYIVFDKATMEQVAKQITAAMEKMKEQMAKLPPEQRAQLEQAMGGAGMGAGQKWSVDAIDTGTSDKVGGRACKLWDVKRNDKLDEQICVVPYAALPGKEDLKVVFAKFAKVFEEMAKSVPMLSGMMSNEFSALVKANGYPVRSRSYDNGKLADDETLVKVWREEAIPASMFEIPAGYKPKKMPMGPGQ
jgi:outer membrane lipoprotein-sorting protein